MACTGVERPFGGKTILATGDFRQLPPVVASGSRGAVLAASVKASPLWSHFEVWELRGPSQRSTVEDREFATWIEALGVGRVPHCDRNGVAYPDQEQRQAEGGAHTVLLPPHLFSKTNVFTEEAAFQQWVHNPEALASVGDTGVPTSAAGASRSSVVCPRNDQVDHHNSVFLQGVPGDVIHLTGYERIREGGGGVVTNPLATEEFMASLKLAGRPDHDLSLKIGALVVCTRNLGRAIGCSNGTRLEVLAVRPHVVICRKVSGERADAVGDSEDIVAVPRLLFDLPIPKSDLIVQRRQFPLRLSYSNTVHKVQGQSLRGRVGLDLRLPVFSHGQLYVAASRSGGLHAMAFLVNAEDIVDTPEGRAILLFNITYPELLSHGVIDSSAEADAAPPATPVPFYPEGAPPAESDGELEGFEGLLDDDQMAWDDAPFESVPTGARATTIV